MRIDRLTKLKDLLETDAANPQSVKFDLHAWGYDTEKGSKYSNNFDPTAKTIPLNCGTAACGWGLAAISGIFADEGVTFKIDNDGDLLPMFDGSTAFDAAARFFELNSNTTFQLFDPMYYNVKKGAEAEQEVVRRIKSLIETGRISDVPSDDDLDDIAIADDDHIDDD
jgi:hypothetical protein